MIGYRQAIAAIMIQVYIDTGGLHPAVRDLERAGLLHTSHHPVENRNARVTTILPGADATADGVGGRGPHKMR